jgi:hypothetical protein
MLPMAESAPEMAFLQVGSKLTKPPDIRADDAYAWPGRVA